MTENLQKVNGKNDTNCLFSSLVIPEEAPEKDNILSKIDIQTYYERELAQTIGPGENLVRCPFHDDRDPSLSVNGDNGKWKCHAGCGGGDLIAFHQKKYGLSFRAALTGLGEIAGVAEESHIEKAWRRARLAKTCPATVMDYLKGRGISDATVSRLWADGLVGFTARAHRHNNEYAPAVVFPLVSSEPRLVGLQNVFPGGGKKFAKGTPAKAAFFVVGDLGGGPTAVTEGVIDAISVYDATGNAAIAILSAGTAGKLKNLDISDPVLCLDNDDAGRSGAAKALEILGRARVAEYRNGAKDPNDLLKAGQAAELRKMIEGAKEKKMDLGDCENSCVTLVTCVTEEENNNKINQKDCEDSVTHEESLVVTCVTPFELTEKGLFHRRFDKEGQPRAPEYVCGPVRVEAMTQGADSGDHGRLLEWTTTRGEVRRAVLPADSLIGDGGTIFGKLALGGLDIPPGRRTLGLLAKYLHGCQCDKWIRVTEKTGWYGETYVLPDRSIGPDDFFFHGDEETANFYQSRGSLTDWRENVSAMCAGNSRLLLAASTAFASALLGITGDESGGLHFYGDSSTGKSTAGAVAASVFGGPAMVQNWNATLNAIGATAVAFNDSLMVLDELSQCDPKAAASVAYVLGNGTEKGRADRNGGAKRRRRWRLLFLSNGEMDLSQHLQSVGLRSKAGQDIRLLAIPADAGGGLGLFDHTHGRGAADFADTLKKNASMCYGTAGPEFIKKVAGRAEEIRNEVSKTRRAFIDENLPPLAESQVHRAAVRFGLIAAAGELATRFSITGWDPGDATDAAAQCFQDWLDARGGSENAEDIEILEVIRGHFEQYGSSRYEPRDGSGPSVVNRCGFFEETPEGARDFFVLPAPYKELCRHFDPVKVSRILSKIGAIKTSSGGRYQATKRLPTLGVTRCYHIVGAKLMGAPGEK